MNKKVSFFNITLRRILSDEQSMLDEARIRLLYYGLFLAFVGLITIAANVFLQHQFVFTAISCTLLVSVAILFKFLTWKANWRVIAHTLLVMATIINLLNVFIFIQSVDIVAVQLVILCIIFGFYMLGINGAYFTRWPI